MTQNNYSLEIISHHKDFNGKTLKKYQVEGIDTVGAYGSEEFEIKFTNHTWQKVQVKFSLDGTDILTGKLADTEVNNDMWVVNGYGTMSLKAWPENNQGGAAFVFTSADNSVAVHTHGDLSNRGIIAAAVFAEGHVDPTRLNPVPAIYHHHHYDYYRPYWHNTYLTLSGVTQMNGSIVHSQSMLRGHGESVSLNSCSTNDAAVYSSMEVSSDEVSQPLESLVSVGAGQYTNQTITHVAGLIKPLFAETVRVRYLWWDTLVEKLREHNVPAPHASGFPGDKKQTNINLGGTPRIGGYQKAAFPREQAPVYSRI